ncbi:C6 finger domain transcription factor adaR [Pseudocercospora fuligena]|uniref:C6 finger domain transcription factor adaR n=1 Tax=Pseudocercospora fuligena TaxID=685502 RepID=A0A8H6R899_9PEZI|nr:C6 finger domain transcription factor adaR [Pseudocercospora fuligena]
MSPNTSSAVAVQSKSAAQLSCQTCHRKKIKCDRSYPCGQCINSRSVCNPSTRKARAKNGVKNDTELRRRIAKLEQLVEGLEGHGREGNGGHTPQAATSQPTVNIAGVSSASSAAADAEPGGVQSQSVGHHTFLPDGNDYATGAFWSSLTSEVRALANALDDDNIQGDSESATPETTSAKDDSNASNDPSDGAQKYELILCQPGALYVTLGALNEPDSKRASSLLDSYLMHVERIQKLLHVPTLRAFMDLGRPYINKAKDAPCNKALKLQYAFLV